MWRIFFIVAAGETTFFLSDSIVTIDDSNIPTTQMTKLIVKYYLAFIVIIYLKELFMEKIKDQRKHTKVYFSNTHKRENKHNANK